MEVLYSISSKAATHVSYVPLPDVGWGVVEVRALYRLYIIQYVVSYLYRNGGTHSCAMDLLVKRVVEGTICGI